MSFLRSKYEPAEGRSFSFQPISLPIVTLKLGQSLNADENVVQMLENIRAARALKAHQPQEHDHRQTKPNPVPDEIIGLAKRRVGDDRLKIHDLERLKKVDACLNVGVCAVIGDEIARDDALARGLELAGDRAAAGRGLIDDPILVEASGVDQGARGARVRFVEVVAALLKRPAIGALPHFPLPFHGTMSSVFS